MSAPVTQLRPDVAAGFYGAEAVGEALPAIARPEGGQPACVASCVAAAVSVSGYARRPPDADDMALLPAPETVAGEPEADAKWQVIKAALLAGVPQAAGQAGAQASAQPSSLSGANEARASAPAGDGKGAGSLGQLPASGSLLSDLAGSTQSMSDFLKQFVPLLSLQLQWCADTRRAIGNEIRLDRDMMEKIQQAEKECRLEQIDREREQFRINREISEKAQKAGVLSGVIEIFSSVVEVATGVGMLMTGNPLGAAHLSLAALQIVSGALLLEMAVNPKSREKLQPVVDELSKAIMGLTILTAVFGFAQMFKNFLKPATIAAVAAKDCAEMAEDIGEIAAKRAAKSLGDESLHQISTEFGKTVADATEKKIKDLIGAKSIRRFFNAFFSHQEIAEASATGFREAVETVGKQGAKETMEVYSARLSREIADQVASAVRENANAAMRAVQAGAFVITQVTDIVGHFIEQAILEKRDELKDKYNDLESRNLIFAVHVKVFADLLKRMEERRDKKLDQYQKTVQMALESVQRQSRIESLLLGARV